MKRLTVLIVLGIAAHAEAQTTSVAPPAAGPRAAAAANVPTASSAKSSAASIAYRSSRSSVPPVVVQFSAAEPAHVEEMSEDLEIMTHIIERALGEDAGDEVVPDRMGIKLYLTGSSRSVRPLYVEGFGALFMVKVNFPLQGAPAPKEPAPEKAGDTEWERVRREVLGMDEPKWGGYNGATVVDYEPKRVEALKNVLTRALRNASNIRHLKAEEAVSVSVFGSPGRVQVTRSAPYESPTTTLKRARVTNYQGSAGLSTIRAGDALVELRSTPAPGTVLTLRASKADIDAFAKGNLDEDAFAKKVTFHTYAGAGHDITSLNSWVNEYPVLR